MRRATSFVRRQHSRWRRPPGMDPPSPTSTVVCAVFVGGHLAHVPPRPSSRAGRPRRSRPRSGTAAGQAPRRAPPEARRSPRRRPSPSCSPRPARLGCEHGIEQLQFPPQPVEILLWRPAREARHVDDVDQHARALEMSQEAVAEPDASVAPWIEPRHVGHHEAAIAAELHDAEVRRERRERVVAQFSAARPRCVRSAWTCRRSGKPTRPTSASSFRCRRSALLAGTAGLVLRGARFVDVAK